MSRGLIFLFVVLIIGGLIEWYTYRALKSKWTNYSRWFRITLKSAFFLFLGLSLVSLLLMVTAGSYLPRYINNFFFGFVMINFFVKIAVTAFLLVDDLRRLFIFTKRKIVPSTNENNNGISRSDFLVRAGIIAAAVPAISYPLGMFVGPYNYKVRKENLKFSKLPASFKGLKMIQISDIHAGSFYNKEAVMRGIEMINQEKPDVVFFTGDLVNDSAAEMENYMDVFSKIQAPMGVFSVLGNHDYGDYRSWNSDQEKEDNLKRLKEVHGELGWKLLLDEHVYLERNGEKIAIIGVQNWGAGFHQIGDLKKAYEGVDAPVKILLSHDPTHWDEQVKKEFKDIDLTLSGHTHGAQMGIETHGFKWSPISLRYDKWAGLYQEGEQYLYVNRGYGFLGYPGRIGIWPEITVLELS
jgi:predicted MPP superfamily phosphohydrolase